MNCNECKNISMTEEEQHSSMLSIFSNHMCLKHNRRVIHGNNHVGKNAYIEPCIDCNGKDFEKRV